MSTPGFIVNLREKIGHELLWLTGVTAVVVREDDAVLLCRRADNSRVTPITGIVDPGEEPATAAEREVLEEAGVTAVARALVWVHALPPMTYVNGDQAQYLDLVFRLDFHGGTPHPADGENTEVFWAAAGEIRGWLADDADMLRRVELALAGGSTTRFEH